VEVVTDDQKWERTKRLGWFLGTGVAWGAITSGWDLFPRVGAFLLGFVVSEVLYAFHVKRRRSDG
jgi:uncharacterized membrane protein